MMNNKLYSYEISTKEELERHALVMERILLLISPISVLILLNGVLFFRAFIDWALFKKDFYSNPNVMWIRFSKYIILPLIVVIFVYSVYEYRKVTKYGKL